MLLFGRDQPRTSAEEYRGISDAFEAALHHTFIPTEVAAIVAVLAAGVASVVIVRFVRRERARKRAQERSATERRLLEISAASAERREFVRVPARLSLSIPRTDAPDASLAIFRTEDVSGGGLSYSSKAPPPIGTELDLVLDIDLDGRPSDLPLRGEVVRVQPSSAPRGTSTVGIAFRGIASATRDTLFRWIAAEETREIAMKRRGPLCSVCGRPLGEAKAKVHPTCITAND